MKWLKVAGASVVGLIAVAVIVLVLLGRREGAARLMGSVEIDRPPEVVFAWLTEKDRLVRWVGWLVDVRSSGTGAGSRHVWVMDDPNMKQRIEVSAEVTGYDPGRRLVLRVDMAGGFDGVVRYDLTDLGGGRTRLDHVGRYRYVPWFARLLEPVVTAQAQAKLEQDLARMKGLAESEGRREAEAATGDTTANTPVEVGATPSH